MSDPVGYKRPPQHGRWKKGQSGNPKGRVKGQHNLKTDLMAELSEVIHLKEGGIAKRFSKQRALLKALTARAIQGDGRAANLILNLMLRLIDPEPEPETARIVPAEDAALVKAFIDRIIQAKGNDHDDPSNV